MSDNHNQLIELVKFYRYQLGLEDLTDEFGGFKAKKKNEDEIDIEYASDILGNIDDKIDLVLEEYAVNDLFFYSLETFISYFFAYNIENQKESKITNSYLKQNLEVELEEIKDDDVIKINNGAFNFSKFFKRNMQYLAIKTKKINFIEESLSVLNKDTSINFMDKEGLLHSYYNSQKLIYFICDKIDDYNYLLKKEEDDFIYGSIAPIEIEPDFPFKHDTNSLGKIIVKLFVQLQHTSINEKYFFNDCPLQVYKETYNKRLDEFKEKNVDADIVDFLKAEYSSTSEKHELYINDETYHLPDINELRTKIDFSKKKKLNFIQKKLFENGYDPLTGKYTNNFNEEKEIDDIKTPDKSQDQKSQKENQEKEKGIEETNYQKDIFQSSQSQIYFERCLESLGFDRDNAKTERGFLAVAHAIYENKEFRKNHLKPSLTKKNYKYFISKEYYNNKKIDRLSYSGNREQSVKDFLKDIPFKEQNE